MTATVPEPLRLASLSAARAVPHTLLPREPVIVGRVTATNARLVHAFADLGLRARIVTPSRGQRPRQGRLCSIGLPSCGRLTASRTGSSPSSVGERRDVSRMGRISRGGQPCTSGRRVGSPERHCRRRHSPTSRWPLRELHLHGGSLQSRGYVIEAVSPGFLTSRPAGCGDGNLDHALVICSVDVADAARALSRGDVLSRRSLRMLRFWRMGMLLRSIAACSRPRGWLPAGPRRELATLTAATRTQADVRVRRAG